MSKIDLHGLIILSYLLTISISARTETEPENKPRCFSEHLDTGEIVEVKTESAVVGYRIATARWILGYPTILIDDSEYLKLPLNARQFIFYHECAHLKFKTKDEDEADCASIDMLRQEQSYQDTDVRKLVATLKKEMGMSKRWINLLSCD